MRRPHFQCFFMAAFLTVSPYTPQHFLDLAKEQISVGEKIVLLRRLIQSFPLDGAARTAHRQLVDLLVGSNRVEEALQEYQEKHPPFAPQDAADFTLLDYLLKTGRYEDVLRSSLLPE